MQSSLTLAYRGFVNHQRGKRASIDRQSILGIRPIALIETLVFLSMMVLFDFILGNGDRFITMEPHPFWIIVLMITLQYGAVEALASAFLATIFLLVGNMPDQYLSETIYEYMMRVTTLPSLWIVTALVLGSIRNRQVCEKQALMEKVKRCETAMESLSRSHAALKQSKEQLELRLAEERCSVLTVYNAAKAMEAFQPEDIRSAVMELVRVAFAPVKFSLFGLQDNKFSLEVSHGWKKSEPYARQFTKTSPLVSHLMAKQAPLSIVNPSDEALLAGQGVLAGLIADEKTGAVFGMLKIEDIGLMELDIRMHETFHVVCAWIGRIYANHNQLHAALAPKMPKRPLAETFAPQALYATTGTRLAA
jgi:polysaccharide biosynthesis protein PelD